MADFSRREFLKTALAGTTVLVGCDRPFQKLVPYVSAPEDIVPGQATWYATTCRECPAGCGMLAKNRDGHIIKVEGNPLHPVNGGEPWGKLCPRGQASVQGIYNPDRFRGPVRKDAQGKFQPVTWDEGQNYLLGKISELKKRGRAMRMVFLTNLVTGARKDLIAAWMKSLGAPGPLLYEPYAYEALRKADQIVFGREAIPTYHIEKADFLISFGANFLETWLSNVQYARQFASFHAPRKGRKNFFVYVGPRLSMTAANADQWIPVPPGTEYLVALGIHHAAGDRKSSSPGTSKEGAAGLQGPVPTLEVITQRTGVSRDALLQLNRRFREARNPLALAEGLFCSGNRALENAVAANRLCASRTDAGTIDFSDVSAIGESAPAEKMKELAERMSRGEVDLLFIDRANPIYSLPASWNFRKALESVPLVVSFSSFPDETTGFAHVVLPTHTFLESWGDYSPQKNVRGLMQPVMGPMFDTRQLEDVLLGLWAGLAGPEKVPGKNFYELLRKTWTGAEDGSPSRWLESLQRGGSWRKAGEARLPSRPAAGFSFPPLPEPQEENTFHFITYPTIQFFDGWTANRPFLQELPDPMTNITWGGWVEINPETSRRLGIQKDDLLTLKSPAGTLRVPAYPYAGILPGILAMPIGQGHLAFGRYAPAESGNPLQLLPGKLDPESGGLVMSAAEVTAERAGSIAPLANTDGSRYQHGRNLARALSLEEYAKIQGQPPPVRLPLPEGFSKKDDFYPPHVHREYRWAMIVDLDRCIGCGACVVACYAENNVAVVGRKQVLKGREMSWLHIERYFEPGEKHEAWQGSAVPRVRFLPMLCQHCDAAPCESVCPVFAPQHSPEGINNQVYNRCIGTRFCSQNCPWKVRRFNWFTYTPAAPLHWQLNPDVTVRHKGVMEKCSFCIQRIVEAKVHARGEGRKVRDQEFTTACAQTCPADVFTFGNLLDPESRVSRLARNSRAYQVLGHLNTKPAAIYLQKIEQGQLV